MRHLILHVFWHELWHLNLCICVCIVCSHTVVIATGPATRGLSCLVPLSTPYSYTNPISRRPGPCGHLCPKGPAPNTHSSRLHPHSRSTASAFHFWSESSIVSSGALASLRNFLLFAYPQCTPLCHCSSFFLNLKTNQNVKTIFVPCVAIFMDHKGFFMCLPLIIERLCSLCQISLVLSLRHEEEKGFCSSAISLCVGQWFKNEMKDKLCNFVLFCEYVSAFPLASARTAWLFQAWVISGGWPCENVKLDYKWNAK